MNIYRSEEGGDLRQRVDVFQKFFPDQAYEDFTEAFEDDENNLAANLLYDGQA